MSVSDSKIVELRGKLPAEFKMVCSSCKRARKVHREDFLNLVIKVGDPKVALQNFNCGHCNDGIDFEYEAPAKGTLLFVMNNFLSQPQIIHCRDGKVMIRDSRSNIEKGRVYVNDAIETSSNREVKSGDYIKFGMKRYRQHFIVP